MHDNFSRGFQGCLIRTSVHLNKRTLWMKIHRPKLTRSKSIPKVGFETAVLRDKFKAKGEFLNPKFENMRDTRVLRTAVLDVENGEQGLTDFRHKRIKW